MKERAVKIAKNMGILLIAGMAYYIFFNLTDIGIKCPFYLLTGYLCSGCGISRMFLALLAFDIDSALYYNAAALILLPFWVSVFISYYYEYIRYGRRTLRYWHKAIFIVSVALLIGYGILRNVTHIGLHYSDNIDYKDLILK